MTKIGRRELLERVRAEGWDPTLRKWEVDVTRDVAYDILHRRFCMMTGVIVLKNVAVLDVMHNIRHKFDVLVVSQHGIVKVQCTDCDMRTAMSRRSILEDMADMELQWMHMHGTTEQADASKYVRSIHTSRDSSITQYVVRHNHHASLPQFVYDAIMEIVVESLPHNEASTFVHMGDAEVAAILDKVAKSKVYQDKFFPDGGNVFHVPDPNVGLEPVTLDTIISSGPVSIENQVAMALLDDRALHRALSTKFGRKGFHGVSLMRRVLGSF